jgi:integrase
MGDLSPQIAAILAIQPETQPVRGSIRSQQKCPECGRKGKYRLISGRRKLLVCMCGQYWTDKPEVVVKYQGKMCWLKYDRMGRRIQSIEEAEQLQAEITREIDDGSFYLDFWLSPSKNGFSWENYTKRYLDHEAQRLLPQSQATFDKKKALLRHTAWLERYSLRDIRTSHMQDFMVLPCLKLALAPKTRADLAQELRHLFKWAVAREDIEKMPQIPQVRVPRKTPKWLTAEQQDLVLEHIPKDHRPIFMFMMQYGTRPGEACALCWDKVEINKEMFTLARTFSRRKLADSTKQRRDNPLPIVGWFADWLEGMQRAIALTPVFKNPTARSSEGFYNTDSLNKIWNKAIEMAGLVPIRLYNGTRHSVGTQRSLEGWNREDIARLLGHATTAHTDKYVDQSQVGRIRSQMLKSKNTIQLLSSKSTTKE